MSEAPSRGPASKAYVIGTALLAGVACAAFAWFAARILDVSTAIASIATGITAALLVAVIIRRHGRPTGVV